MQIHDDTNYDDQYFDYIIEDELINIRFEIFEFEETKTQH